MNKTLLFQAVVFSVLAIFSSFLVSAFGVTSPYWDENPLILSPGASEQFALELQNMVGEEDIILKAEIIEGGDIATLIDKDIEYFVPFGRKDIKANLKIEIPEDAPLGEEYQVRVFFRQVSSGEGDMVQIQGGVGKSFRVISGNVVSEPNDASKSGNVLIIGLVATIVFVFLLLYFLKRKEKEKF